MKASEETVTRADLGGGSGGGALGCDRTERVDGTFDLAANRIRLCARPPMPPAVPEQCVVTILATGTGVDGLVDVRGSQGVRVTAGIPVALPTNATSTNGVEIAVGATNNVTIQRGLLPTDGKIELTPAGITIDAGAMGVTIKSLSSIELSVAGGVSKLRLGPEGVTIDALTIRLSAQLQAQLQGLMTTISATAVNKVSGAITMIG